LNCLNATPKYALVTGASSGIGWHLARELAARGYSIVAVSNQEEGLKELKTELERDFSIRVEPFYCDLSESNAAECVFDFCEKNEFQVDILVNNAGLFTFGEVAGTDLTMVKCILGVHMTTPVMLCRLFGAAMVKNHFGCILNVSSISAVMPYPTISLYGPTKTFLREFTRALRFEMKDWGVKVLCLIPGATETALYETKNLKLVRRLGIMKKPEVVARAGIKALFKNRAECTPGLLNKFVIRFMPLIPGGVIGLIYRRQNRRNRS
jgi:short-subunit dehydrogenase